MQYMDPLGNINYSNPSCIFGYNFRHLQSTYPTMKFGKFQYCSCHNALDLHPSPGMCHPKSSIQNTPLGVVFSAESINTSRNKYTICSMYAIFTD